MHSRLRCIRSGRASGLDSRGQPGRYFVAWTPGVNPSLQINWVATEFVCSERVDPAISVMAEFVGFAR